MRYLNTKTAAALALAGALAVTSSAAEARKGRFIAAAGVGLVAGAIIGAAASRPYYRGGYYGGYGGPGYGYASSYGYGPSYGYAAPVGYGYGPSYGYAAPVGYGYAPGYAYGPGYGGYAYAPGYNTVGWGGGWNGGWGRSNCPVRGAYRADYSQC